MPRLNQWYLPVVESLESESRVKVVFSFEVLLPGICPVRASADQLCLNLTTLNKKLRSFRMSAGRALQCDTL